MRRGGLQNTGEEKMVMDPVGKVGVCCGLIGVDIRLLAILAVESLLSLMVSTLYT